jgi:Phosphoenolpyruvate synthase/pyruvate phosphate dikinase
LGPVSLLDRRGVRPCRVQRGRSCPRADRGEKGRARPHRNVAGRSARHDRGEGILTARGGVSSHAALVARQMGKVCVCGATGIQIDYHKGTLSANGTTLNRGDYISIDGTAGEVLPAKSPPLRRDYSGARGRLARSEEKRHVSGIREVDEVGGRIPQLGVRANADTPEQVKNAVASARKESGSAARSICFLKATGSTRCGR